LVQSVNRRCAAATVTPNDGGRYRHAQPLVNTNTIAVNTARSSTGVVPPPCGRGSNPGINGCANAHSSSVTNRRDRSSTTETIMILPALMTLLGDKSWWPSRAVLWARAAAPRSR